MAQTTWVCNADARIATDGSGFNAGAGASPALPVGQYSGYTYHSLLAFAHNIGSLNVIDKAVLWLRTSDQYYISFGSDPDVLVDRITGSWGEGSSSGLSESNAVKYPGPPIVITERVTRDISTETNTWISIDITALIRAAKTAGQFYGVRLAPETSSASDVTEFWAREKGSSYRAYIVVDYTNNRAPNAPSLTTPVAGARFATTATPTFTGTGSDPDAGDTPANFEVQVHSSTVGDAGSLVWTSGLIATSSWSFSRAYGGPALGQGSSYYWRARFTDKGGLVGAWSAWRSFTINALPTISGLPAGGANHVAVIHNLADKVTALTPKPQFVFSPSAIDGEAITGYQVEIQTLGGAAVATETATGSWASNASITHKCVTTLTNLSAYRVRFRARDAFEGYGAWSAFTTFSVKYLQAIYQYNIPGAGNLTVTKGAIVGSSAFLYRTASGVDGAGAGAWNTAVPPTVPAYLNILVRLASSGAAPLQPSLTSLKVQYLSGSILPLSWAPTPVGHGWAIDPSARRYGTKSVVNTKPGATEQRLTQTVVNLTVGQDYVASVWINIEGAIAGSGGLAGIVIEHTDLTDYGLARLGVETNGWQRLTLPFVAEETSIVFGCIVGALVPAGVSVNFDAAMVSEGTVAPVWTPALSGEPVIVDAQGIVVDGEIGGLLRVFNNAGIPTELGAGWPGISFNNGDAVLYRGGVNALQTDNHFIINSTAGYLQVRSNGPHTLLAGPKDQVTNVPFRIGSLGEIDWGDGTAARDTSLLRGGANLLQLASGDSFNLVSGTLRVAGTQVIGTRKTGWAAATGTPTRTTFATTSVTLPQLAERVKALIDDLTTHGLIGA